MRRTSNNAKPVTWTDECSNEQVAVDDRLDSTLISWLSNCFFIYTSIFTFCLRVISHFLSHFSLSLFFFLSHTKCTFREAHLSLTTNASLLALLIAATVPWQTGRQEERVKWAAEREARLEFIEKLFANIQRRLQFPKTDKLRDGRYSYKRWQGWAARHFVRAKQMREFLFLSRR